MLSPSRSIHLSLHFPIHKFGSCNGNQLHNNIILFGMYILIYEKDYGWHTQTHTRCMCWFNCVRNRQKETQKRRIFFLHFFAFSLWKDLLSNVMRQVNFIAVFSCVRYDCFYCRRCCCCCCMFESYRIVICLIGLKQYVLLRLVFRCPYLNALLVILISYKNSIFGYNRTVAVVGTQRFFILLLLLLFNPLPDVLDIVKLYHNSNE